ncbi:MAG: acyltransferase domain-containing protein [Pedosphaera sp.]|nr:acyltransferase domain-containing protein [Pedosphaera sp.]
MGTRPQTASEPAKSSIAVIGMGCIYPGAHSPEELWANVLAGRRFFRKAPPERMPPEYFDPDPLVPDKSYCDRMAVITGWEFDPLQFRIPPVTVRSSDIAHWLALHTADLALKNTGLDLALIDRTRAGVMLGNSLTGEFSRANNLRLRWPYAERALQRSLRAQGMDEETIRRILPSFRESFEAPFLEANEDTLAGNMSNTIAGRVCNHFDFGGGGFTVDGACSSSLLGVVIACDALVKGDLDFAVAGGVDVSLDPFEIVGFAKTQALAREDIRPYDERAGGMMTGEGCGLVVLMREADARARGLKIHALLKGWAYSSDGKGGITAPEVAGQARALSRAYERAGYPMSSVGYIEGHGTGTPVGDKVELTAIQRVLQSDGGEIHCSIGSIKANIGHCKAAAGAAGLIKTIQTLKHKILPPTLNCERPINAFSQSDWKLRPSLKGKVWDANGAPRRASVSSMGFGGANSHVTLEEANPDGQPTPEDLALLGSAQSSELILLAAASVDELRKQIEKLIPIAGRVCHAELTDLAAALAKRPLTGDFRLGIVTASPWGLADSLRSIAARLAEGAELSSVDAPSEGIFAGKALNNPSFIALFPGQGSQRLNMGDHLLRRYPFARELYEAGNSGLVACIFRDTLAADEATTKQWESNLRDTKTAQPAIVLSSVTMFRVLEFFGLKPVASIGHSLGEISALHAAGAFDAAIAVRLAALRGQAMSSLQIPDPGAMLAIAAKAEDVEELLRSSRGNEAQTSASEKTSQSLLTSAATGRLVVISNYNSSRQTVVSGATDSVARLRQVCADRNIRCQQLPVSHAFHSDIVAPAAAAFRSALESATLQHLTGRVISTSTGDEIAADTDLKELLAQQIRRPVRFLDAVQKANALRPALWIEVGPGGVLTSFVRNILGADSVHCLPTDLAGEDCFHLLNQVLARAFILGFPLATERLFAHRFHRPFDVENYHPVFIVNPCERPVELTTPVEPLALMANGGGDDEFLREFAELYQRHHVGNPSLGVPASAGSGRRKAELQTAKTEASQSLVTSAATETKDAANDKDALLTFAIDWIAKRTGFPKSAIGPDKKLRDDLNLDSIKVGELVVLLSRKWKRTIQHDPASLSNATLNQLVSALLEQIESTSSSHENRKVVFQPTESLGEWVRTFRIAHAPAPIESQTARPLRTSGTAVIIAAETSPHAAAIADALRQKGLSPIISNAQSLTQSEAPRDLAALILVLPSVGESFLDCTPAQFDERVEGLATHLFQVFRWVLAARSTDDSPLSGLVLRPAADNGDASSDLDAGAGFLKSVLLENPNADFKWVSLPAHWSPDRWAELAVREMEHSGRMAVAYSADGQRTADVAHPLGLNGSSGSQHGLHRVELVGASSKAADKLGEALKLLTTKLTEFRATCSQDPEHPDRDSRLAMFEEVFAAALDEFQDLAKSMTLEETRKHQQRVYKAIKPFVAESDAFRRILEKPLGYPGDHLLMEMMGANSVTARGIGYHFDRSFLSRPGSEAVRQRTKWTVAKLASSLSRQHRINLLDLGCGPMLIERILAGGLNENQSLDVLGLDFDQRALDHAQSHLVNARVQMRTKLVNLLSPVGIDQLREFSKNVDVCICMGLIEYLQDETVVVLLETIHDASRKGTNVLLANFKPDHFSRPSMEWLQDWWLVYRTEADMKRLAMAAGFDEGKIRTSLDEISSLVLVELEK